MAFALAYIELHIDNDTFEAAEQYLESNCLTSYIKSEYNLWTGVVNTDRKYEVEARISSGKVNKISCDCKSYGPDDPCAHIAAMLIKLRRDQLTRQTEPKQATNRVIKVKISDLLQKVDKDTLANFIQQYARKNKPFANELKAFLSPLVADVTDSAYYNQLIQSAMRMSRKKDNDISAKGAAHIKIITEELWLQAEDKMASKKYTEATAILKALSLQLPLIIDKLAKDEYFVTLYDRTMQAFSSFPDTIVSPELTDEIFRFINQDLPVNPIMLNNLDKQYFDTLLTLAYTEEKKKVLKLTIEEIKSQSANWNKKNYINIILFEVLLAQKEGKSEQVEALIQDHLRHPDILFHALKDAAENENWKQVKRLAEVGLEQNFNKSLQQVLYQYLYQEAFQAKNKKRISQFAEKLYFMTYESQYLEEAVKNIAELEIPKYYRNLLEKIENTPFENNKKEAVAELYLRLDTIDELFAYIKKIKSLDLLKNLTPVLVNEYKKEIYDMYLYLISDYLAYHLGPVPTQRVRNILLHLRKLGNHDLVHAISDKLIKDFPERPALLQELEIL